MKILYFGDGKSRSNWGAQATSTALQELLKEEHTIIDTVISELKTRLYKVFPGPDALRPYQVSIEKRKGKAPYSTLYSLLKALGLKESYITDDVEESLQNFLRIKKHHAELNQIYESIKKCDAIVLNGEGTFIFTTPPRRDSIFFLLMLKLAKQLGKKTYCLNAMISDCPVNGRNQRTVKQMVEIFKTVDGITVRDPQSLNLLNELQPDLKVSYIPDALFTWGAKLREAGKLPEKGSDIVKFPATFAGERSADFSKPYICISGSSLAAWSKKEAVAGYVTLVNQLKNTGLDLYIIPTSGGDAFLQQVADTTGVPIIPGEVNILTGAAILGHASVFVSGRFHPSILASLSATPCVFMGSNSHKTRSLQKQLDYPEVKEYNAIPTEADSKAIYADVTEVLAHQQERRTRIENAVSKLAADARQVLKVLN